MAFDISGFYPDPRAGGLRVHTYTTTDAIATVNTAGYFNDLYGIVNVPDVIYIASSTGTTPVVSHSYFTAVGSGAVDIVDGVAITNTDSD